MPKYDGIRYECNRCNRTEFVPYVPLRAKYGDEAPGEWMQVALDKDVWLCPSCGEKFKLMVASFIKEIDPLKL